MKIMSAYSLALIDKLLTIFSQACDKLREIAETLKIKAAEVTKMLKEIVAKGIVKAKEIIEKIKAKLFPALENEGKNLFFSQKFISRENCDRGIYVYQRYYNGQERC